VINTKAFDFSPADKNSEPRKNQNPIIRKRFIEQKEDLKISTE